MSEVKWKLLKILRWGGGVILVAFVLLVIVRMFVLDAKEKTAVEVAKIHATKLTLDDVMGKDLPAAFAGDASASQATSAVDASASQAYYDATVQGVDVNKNGIRDDVELAIFREYPNSAKTRAVLLQYALALQMEVTQKIVNQETVTAVAEQRSRGFLCIGEVTSRENMKKFIETGDKFHNFIESRQLNNEARRDARENFYKILRSGDVPSNYCDLDLTKFSS